MPVDVEDSEFNRMAFSDNYQFVDFYQKMVRSLAEEPVNELNIFCEEAFESYKGNKACAYNIARAFVDTKKFLHKTLGSNSEKWVWRNVHVNEYPSTPWSKTPLKPLFHRELPTAGNT
jgi:hypothetical protein